MKWFLLVFISIFLTFTASAEESGYLKLEPGLWEGISQKSGMDYYLLQLKDSGEHQLIVANIASAFRRFKVYPFKNEDISCDYSACNTPILRHDEEDSATKLIITPYLDDPNGSLNALEINHDNNNKPILSRMFHFC